MTDRFANLTKACGGVLSIETLQQFVVAMCEFEIFTSEMGALTALVEAELPPEPEQHDAHVEARDRHLDWLDQQWCASNGISFVTECGTRVNFTDD